MVRTLNCYLYTFFVRYLSKLIIFNFDILHTVNQIPGTNMQLSLPMPPLAGVPVRGSANQLEEPNDLGSAYRRSFSSTNELVRNSSPLGTPVGSDTSSVARRTSGHLVVGSPDSNAKEQLLAIYTEKNSAHELSKLDKTNIAEVAKQHVVGRMKFVLPDRKFPSFWQPDLYI
jgi:hypothetical protein